MNRPIRKRLVAIVAILGMNLAAAAQEEPIRFNRIPVDSEQLSQLLKSGTIVPIKRDEFERRVQSAENRIAPRDEATIDRVTYKANLGDQTLNGTFRIQLPQDESPEKRPWVFLGKPNFNALALNAPAQWGRDATGNAIAKLGDSATIHGTWSLKGKKQPWGTEIVFKPLMALSTELSLTLPASLQLETDADVSPRQNASGTETTWNISIRSKTATTLRIVKPGTFRRPPVVDARTTWSVRKETTQIRSEISLQTFSPVSEFSVLLPSETAIESVLYGDNTPVPIAVSDTKAGRELKVTLPRPIDGPGRRLVLTARLPIVVGKSWTVPRLDRVLCELDSGPTTEAIPRRITHSVFVESPLELTELDLKGFKQSNNAFQADGSQTLSLTRIFEDGTATLRIGEARRARQHRIATSLRNDRGVWKQRTLIIADTPFSEEVLLDVPSELTILAITTGSERTPCDFRIEGDSGNRARVFVPPANNTVIEVSGQTNDRPSATTTTVNGTVITNLLVVKKGILDEEAQPLPAIPLRQFRSDFGRYPDATFVGPDDIIIQSAPGTTVKFKAKTNVFSAHDEPVIERDESPRADTRHVSSMHLTSSIQLRPDPDRHEARIEILTEKPVVTFKLDESAELLSVETNGTRLRASRHGESVVVPVNTLAETNVLVVRYTCSTPDGSVLGASRAVPVPEFDQARDFTWRVLGPPDLRVRTTAPFGQNSEQTNSLTKLLGPLRTSDGISKPTLITMPHAPKVATITFASERTRQRCGWIALMVAAIAGLLLVPHIAPSRFCALEAVLAILAIVLPEPFGTICGGCLLGGLFGLASANILRPTGTTDLIHRKKRSALPSSAVVGSLVLIACLATESAFGHPQQPEIHRVYEGADQDTVYVNRKLLRQLETRDAGSQNLLIQSARYVVSIGDGSVAAKATFESLLMDKTQSTTVSFPFAAANVSQCRVNGELTDFTKDKQDIRLTIPPQDADESDSKALIELELYPPARNGGCGFSIVPAGISTCELDLGTGIEARLNGVVVEPNSPQPVTTQIDVTVQSPNAATNQVTPATISSDCVIELGASETTFDHTVVVTPGTKPVTELTLRFPASHRFTSLTADQQVVQQVVSAGPNTFAVVRFTDPVVAPTSVRLKLASTNRSTSGERVLQLEPVVDGLSNVTVQARPGLRLKNIRWVGADESPPQPVKTNQNRSAAFSMGGPGRLTFSLETTAAVRDLQLTQRIHVSASELEYSVEGKMDIEDGPVFAHTLIVTPNLQIESIQVRENGVDRLTRYQRDGDRLLLFLEGRTSGRQTVTLEARMPLPLNTLTTLPQAKVQDARFRQSTLVLSRESDVKVHLINNKGIPFAVRPDTALTDSLESGEATFELLESTVLPQIRTQRISPLSAQAICFQRKNNNGTAGWTWAFQITPDSEQDQVQLDPTDGTVQTSAPTTTNDEGIVTVSLDDKPVVVVVDFDNSDLKIPEPEWQEVSITSRMLALRESGANRLAASPNSELTVPAWASTFATGGMLLYDGNSDWELVERNRNAPRAQPTPVRQIETTLWQHGNVVAGKTSVAIAQTPYGLLELQLPAQTTVRSVESDGRVLSFDLQSSQLLIPCPDSTEVTIRWMMSAVGSEFHVPSPQMDSGEMLFAFLPESNESTLASPELANIGRTEYLANRRIQADPPARSASLFLGRISGPIKAGQRLNVVPASRSTLKLGIGLLCGLVVFGVSLSASNLRSRHRVPFLLVGVALLLLVTSSSLPVVIGLTLTAALLWWYIPRKM